MPRRANCELRACYVAPDAARNGVARRLYGKLNASQDTIGYLICRWIVSDCRAILFCTMATVCTSEANTD